MTDLIEDLVAKRPQEKTAIGVVDDIDVRLEKTSYETRMWDVKWKVAAFREDTGHTNQTAGLSAEEADQLFQKLVSIHDLNEVTNE